MNDFNVSLKSDEIVYTNIASSKDDYSSARMVSKIGKKTFLTVNIEWEGPQIPDLVMEMMMFMRNSGMETSRISVGKEKDYEEFLKTLDK